MRWLRRDRDSQPLPGSGACALGPGARKPHFSGGECGGQNCALRAAAADLRGALAGAGPGCIRAIIQGVLAIPWPPPGTIGVNAGAGLAAALCCAAVPTAVAAVPLAAMAGAFFGAVLVLAVAERTGASRLTLVLAGVALSGVFNAGVDAVVTFVPEALNGYSDFRIGGLSGVSMAQLLPALGSDCSGHSYCAQPAQ